MQNKKTLGIVVAILGLILLAVALLADTLGLGTGGGVFGPKQIVAAVAGALLIVVGIVFATRK